MGFDSIIEPLNEWLVSAPYASAFCVTALKASSADQIAQARERRLYATGVMRRRQQQQLNRATAAAAAAAARALHRRVERGGVERVGERLRRDARGVVLHDRRLLRHVHGDLAHALERAEHIVRASRQPGARGSDVVE